MDLLYFRTLGEKSGPFYDEHYPNPNENPYVKALAAEAEVPDIDSETGDVIMRLAISANAFPAPFPNEPAARGSNGGVLPPDLSVIIKARPNGPRYIYSLLSGYALPPPEGLEPPPGQFFNPYMAGDVSAFWTGAGDAPQGGFIAMPPPLFDERIAFDDSNRSRVDQLAKDVVAFLTWASDPKATERKQFGLGAMIYLLIFSVLLWFSYRRIWRNVSH